MSSYPASLPDDPLDDLVSLDDQRHAAQLVQQTFADVFRQSAALQQDGSVAADTLAADMQTLQDGLQNWVILDARADAQTARLALLLSGLDQWGLAYAQAFGLEAIPLLSALVGSLRTRLDEQADARFAQQFALLAEREIAAIDFKIATRRAIHLALWHAMAACATMEAAQPIVQQLGSLLLSLTRSMPELGWRLVADALAHIQIQCLSGTAASEGVGQEATQALFAALDAHLDKPLRDRIMAHAAQATIQWQQAMRRGAH